MKRNRLAQKLREEMLREFLIAEKESKPCTDCGQWYPACVMDFDHVRGPKHFGVSRGVQDARGIDAIRTEIEKCDLVCANCHRIRTHARKGSHSR